MAMSRALCLALVGLMVAAVCAEALPKLKKLQAKSHGVGGFPAGYEERIAVKPLAAANAHLQAGMFKLSPARATGWGSWSHELQEHEAAPALSMRSNMAVKANPAAGFGAASEPSRYIPDEWTAFIYGQPDEDLQWVQNDEY